ncbi:MAG: insulinase family protein [Cellulosilyticaceae bacterium]
MKRKLLLIVSVLLLQVLVVFGQDSFKETEKVTKRQDTIHTYQHDKTGLEVVWIESDDPNWSFALGVRTPVSSDTGVNHIIEHTVFKGSGKYPSHQLFFDASAKYPHSFMNAMTSADMTYYPFATPYPKCFDALLDVYLDSVLHPIMLESPYSFYEEAYYKDPTTGKEGGVVYNEMKGANSSIDRQVFKSIREAYFEGGTYGYDSGGMPQAIKGLTYDYFKETYNNYYHPSNMQIVLYGKLPIQQVLDQIATQISSYEMRSQKIVIDDQITQTAEVLQKPYQSQNHKGFLLKSFLIDKPLTLEEQLRMSLWVSTYLQDNAGTFQSALREVGLKSVQVLKDEGTKTPIYTIAVGDIPLDQIPTYEEKLESVIENMSAHIPTNLAQEKDMLARQRLALLQEGDSSQRGLSVATTYLEEWLHEVPKHSYYTQLDVLEEMQSLDNQWCQEILLTGVERTTRMIPSLVSQQEVAVTGPEAWQGVSSQIESWKKAHQDANLPEIRPEELLMKSSASCDVSRKDGVTYMMSPTGNPSLYTTVYYPSHHIKQEELPYLFLYGMLLDQASRECSPFEAFLNVRQSAVNGKDGEETYFKVELLQADARTNPVDIIGRAQNYLEAQTLPWYKEKIERWLQSYRENFTGDILGTLQAINESSNEGAGRYLFETNYPLFQFVIAHMDTIDSAFIKQVLAVGNQIKPVEGMKVGLIGEEQIIQSAKKTLVKSLSPEKAPEQAVYTFKTYPKNNLYSRTGGVDYVVYSYEELDKLVNGNDYVTAAYATLGYLQPVIRGVQGAYGSGMSVAAPYRQTIYTYRDPDYRQSMNQIDKMAQTLSEQISPQGLAFARTEALGVFQKQYQLLGSKQAQAEVLQRMELLGIKPSYIDKTQKQILKCNEKQLKAAAEDLARQIDESRVGICTQPSKAPRDFNGVVYK